MEAPLSGIRVLDFGMAAVGPVSAEWMAWLGADVIKVESPAGDLVRRGGHRGAPGWAGHTFLGNNIGKRGIILDLKKDEDRATALELVKTADILLENFRSPEILERLGLGWDVISNVNPRLIYLQSSAWGPVGPMVGKPSFEWVTQAFGGFTSVTGQPGGAPEFSRGIAGFDWNGAMINLEALLTALYVRNRTGRGTRINTSQFQSTLVGGMTRSAEYFATGRAPRPMGSARPNIVPDEAFKAADGYITVTALHDAMWQRLCAAIERSDLAQDARYKAMPGRVEHRASLVASLAETFSSRPMAEWVTRLRRHRVPVGQFQTAPTIAASLLEDAQVTAGHMVSLLQQTGGGDILTAEPHWIFDKTQARITRPAPGHGEHQQEVLAELESWAPTAPTVLGGGEGLALEGLRVIDFSQGISGPLCGMQLGDLGADVIKVEPPNGDWLRQIPPFQGTEGAVFVQLNRNKRGIALDLKTEAGREFAKRLVATADIVVEGYRPGVMLRLGLDYATLSADNPRLVYCSISGYGTVGPLADQPASELDVQAIVGATREISTPQQPPVRFGFDQASTTAGLAGVQGILAALLYRDRTGIGQHVETSLLAAEVAVHQWTFTAERNPADQVSNAFLGINAAPDYGWPTADGPVLISIRLNEYETGWVPFLKALGLGDLLEAPRFSMPEALNAYLPELREILDEKLKTMPREEVRRIVEDEVGAAFAPMLDLGEVAGHGQTAALGMITAVEGHPTVGAVRTVNTPWLFDRELASLRRPAPLLGQHTTEIAREAGYSEKQARTLGQAAAAVVGVPAGGL